MEFPKLERQCLNWPSPRASGRRHSRLRATRTGVFLCVAVASKLLISCLPSSGFAVSTPSYAEADRRSWHARGSERLQRTTVPAGFSSRRSAATQAVKPSFASRQAQQPHVSDELTRSDASILGTLFGWVGKGVSVVAALVSLLYITRAMEGFMDNAGGSLAGSTPLIAGALGLVVGALHTFAGPDHLAGLAPLIVGQRRSPWAAFGLGALWGSGHATGQLVLGIGCLAVRAGLLRSSLAPTLGKISGVAVGASLVAIGVLGFKESRAFQDDIGEVVPEGDRFGWATFVTGVLHGLSLDALIFITPALALPWLSAGLHVAGVVLGTLLSMGVYTAVLSALCRRSPRFHLISTVASSIAILLGALIVLASVGVHVPLPGIG